MILSLLLMVILCTDTLNTASFFAYGQFWLSSHIIPTETVHSSLLPSRVRRAGWPYRSKSAWHWSCWQSLFLWRKSFCTLFNETARLCLPPWPQRHIKHQRSLWECLFGCGFLLHTTGILDVYPEIRPMFFFCLFFSGVCCAAKPFCSYGCSDFTPSHPWRCAVVWMWVFLEH